MRRGMPKLQAIVTASLIHVTIDVKFKRIQSVNAATATNVLTKSFVFHYVITLIFLERSKSTKIHFIT